MSDASTAREALECIQTHWYEAMEGEHPAGSIFAKVQELIPAALAALTALEREVAFLRTDQAWWRTQAEQAEAKAAALEQEREWLQRVVADKYPAPPNYYLRRLNTDLQEAEARAEQAEAALARVRQAAERHLDATAAEGPVQSATWIDLQDALRPPPPEVRHE